MNNIQLIESLEHHICKLNEFAYDAAKRRAYYQANKEKILAQQKAYHQANREKKAAQRQALDNYYSNNNNNKEDELKLFRQKYKDMFNNHKDNGGF